MRPRGRGSSGAKATVTPLAVVALATALLAACGGGQHRSALSAATTTEHMATSIKSTVTATTSTTTANAAGSCGFYDQPPDRSVPTVPGTTTPRAPVNRQIQSRLLGPADIPCSRPTTLAAVDVIDGQFSPCGYHFDDTSAAISHDSIVLQLAGGYADNQPTIYVTYIQEDVALFSPKEAIATVASFRARMATCPKDKYRQTTFTDIPHYHLSNGQIAPQEWHASPVSFPTAGADEAFGISFGCCEPGQYVLEVLRKGPYVAFVRLFFHNVAFSSQAVPPLVAKAAARLAGS